MDLVVKLKIVVNRILKKCSRGNLKWKIIVDADVDKQRPIGFYENSKYKMRAVVLCFERERERERELTDPGLSLAR